MSDIDTSAEAVERLAAFHALSVQRYDADEESGLRACAHMTAATLRALLAERDAERVAREHWQSQVQSTVQRPSLSAAYRFLSGFYRPPDLVFDVVCAALKEPAHD
jgi:hypothetical protein